MDEAASKPGSDPTPSVKRTPVKAEALNAEAVTDGKTIGIGKGGDQAATVQGTGAEGVTPKPVGKENKGKDAVSAGTGEQGRQEPRPAAPAGGPGSSDPLAELDYVVPASYVDHDSQRRVTVKKNLDALVLAVQAELKALLDARRTMSYGQRELTRLQLKELTDVLVALQDQREAHRLIERYFDLLATNPAAAQKLPGMGAMKRIAGGMANADKASKADGRKQAEKGKKRADAFLDDASDATAAAQ